jgi:tetratricopeptide (TPR) repeat protein
MINQIRIFFVSLLFLVSVASAQDLNSLLQQAGQFYINGKYAEAEKLYLKILTVQEDALGRETPDYANSLVSLGALYYVTNDFEKAEKFYLEALSIQEKVYGKESIFYALSLQILGSLNTVIGDYTRSEKFYLEALPVMEKVLGREIRGMRNFCSAWWHFTIRLRTTMPKRKSSFWKQNQYGKNRVRNMK